MAPAFCAFPAPNVRSPASHRPVTCTSSSAEQPSLPRSYTDIRASCARAIAKACASGVRLQEVQFPAVANLGTAALNEVLDANRAFAKSLLLQLRATVPERGLVALFPDADEAELARMAWRDGLPAPTHALDAPPDALDLAIAVNPGFNVSEWFALEKVDAQTLVLLNADLDRVRSSYYPRIFYPRLYDAKQRFLRNFTEVFYYKKLSDGGSLLREFPAPWAVFYRPLPPRAQSKAAPPPRVIWQGDDRPDFKDVQAMLRKARTDDQLLRASRS